MHCRAATLGSDDTTNQCAVSFGIELSCNLLSVLLVDCSLNQARVSLKYLTRTHAHAHAHTLREPRERERERERDRARAGRRDGGTEGRREQDNLPEDAQLTKSFFLHRGVE